MLTITHTITESDRDALTEYFNRRLKDTLGKQARWPFRLFHILMSFFVAAMGYHLLPTQFWGGLFCLVVGLLLIFGRTILPIVAWMTLHRIRNQTTSSIGTTVQWQFDGNGISFADQRYPWSKFSSFIFDEAGVIVDGKAIVWIPTPALQGKDTESQLQAILMEHIKKVA